MSRAVFLDTVGILALLDEDDQWHSAARSAFELITRNRCRTITTEYVLLECGNAASRRPYRQEISDLRNRMRDRGTVVMPTSSDVAEAWQAYDRG
jgi:predicted nucleic acid-binding protein